MTLENLRGIGRLHPHSATPTEIRRLLVSAEAALADGRRSQNSAATRFDMVRRAGFYLSPPPMRAGYYLSHPPVGPGFYLFPPPLQGEDRGGDGSNAPRHSRTEVGMGSMDH